MNAVDRDTLSDEQPLIQRVVNGLAAMVRTELSPGAQLPSEAALAGLYGASRLTIREALKVLAGRGLLDLARGRRARVRQPDGAAISDLLAIATQQDAKSFFDLVEVRQALEAQSASLAAKRSSRAGLAAVEGALLGMRQALADMGVDRSEAEQTFNRCDVGFHEALALASGNRMLALFLEAMAVPLADSFRMSMRGRAFRGQTHAATLSAHQAIFDSVKRGDSRAAAQAMRAHLKDAERDLRAVIDRGAM